MAKEFSIQFANMSLTKGQELVFQFRDNEKEARFKCTVKEMEGAIPGGQSAPVEVGPFSANASIIFEKAEGAMISLTGSSKG